MNLGGVIELLLIRLIRFIRGYVCFEAEGGFCERFVNLCTSKKIPLWNLKRNCGGLYAETSIDGYKRIRFPSTRSGSKVHIVKKRGLPFFFDKNKSRRGILVGITLSAFIMLFLSTMIWSVGIEGNVKLESEDVLTVFANHGVKIGAFKSKIKPEDVCDEVQKDLPELLWANVNIKGSRVEIVVKERTEAPEFPNSETPCNILAGENAQITEVNAKIGEPKVKAGDLVLKGDLLISGVVDNQDGSTSLKASRGEVYALVERNISVGENLPEMHKLGRKRKRIKLSILGAEIPLGFNVNGENYFKSGEYLTDENVVLPLGIIKEHSFDFGEKAVLNAEQQKLYCLKSYARKYYIEYENGRIVSSEYKLTSENGKTVITDNLSCIYDIGKTSEILIEN